MRFPFLDRSEEKARLARFLSSRESGLAVLYGRRRCGKSRLLQEALRASRSVYYVADDRESMLQRSALAQEIGRRVPGFENVTYPDWDALFSRWWEAAEPGMVLALDEFPALVSRAEEVPSILQKYIDRPSTRGPHLALAGSSQRMMQGLVLDRTAPLFGRAREILRIGPLPAGWIRRALHLTSGEQAVDALAVWGGIPRYWELASQFRNLDEAIRSLILSPLGVLHDEPSGLLLDDLRDTAQAKSILLLVGQGCHRLSEIAARLGKPATSLSRPLHRLLEMGIVRRESPFGSSEKSGKRTLYRISDPFLRYWFRYVGPNRSRLEAGQTEPVAREITTTWPQHVSTVWEDLVRDSLPRATYFGRGWNVASPWWGAGRDGKPMEIDVVAESQDGKSLLLGEAKWTSSTDWKRLAAALRHKAENFPVPSGRKVLLGLWTRHGPRSLDSGTKAFGPNQVLAALR